MPGTAEASDSSSIPNGSLRDRAPRWNGSILGVGLRLLAVELAYFLACWSGILLGAYWAQSDIIWPANGILLAVLLRSHRRTWTRYLACSFAASVLAHRALHVSWPMTLIFSIANIVEVSVAAALVRPKHAPRPDLTNSRTLMRFALYGVVLAPLLSGAAYAILRSFVTSFPGFLKLGNWYVGDALGLAVMTPLFLAIRQEELRLLLGRGRRLETVGLLTALAAVSFFVFGQSDYPITFLLFPALLLVIFRLGSSGAAVGAFLLAIPGTYFTVTSRGPFSLLRDGTLLDSVLFFQCFLCILLAMVYAVAAALASRTRLEAELTEAYRQMEALAGVDPLTGLANRRTFDNVLTREWQRAIRSSQCISMLMLDVDHFKMFNDRHGHVAGDTLLRAIATVIPRVLGRVTDLTARYGGEEFAIILPNTPADIAFLLAERLRHAVAVTHLEQSLQDQKSVTISIGVATMRPARGSYQNLLVEAADGALYLAKYNGRDQVRVWRESATN